MRIIALTGIEGGTVAELLGPEDFHLCAPADRSARIQELHLLILHCLCDGIDCLLLRGGRLMPNAPHTASCSAQPLQGRRRLVLGLLAAGDLPCCRAAFLSSPPASAPAPP